MKEQLRRDFVKNEAPALAAAVRDGPAPWSASVPLSTQFGWFADEDRLIVVGCPGESQRDLDFGLAYGLAHAGDRELVLVLPRGSETATQRRIPWLDTHVTLHVHDQNAVHRVPPLARHEVLIGYDDSIAAAAHQLGERGEWVDRLTTWADTCPELVPAHRKSYLAWHCRGRMLLKVRRSRGAVTVTAGVHHSAEDLAPVPIVLTGELAVADYHRVLAAVSTGIADRLDGVDDANAEHLLQERLAGARSKLGLTVTIREFPAIRSGGGRGFIDLLGIGTDGTIHVVETKIGPDTMLGLQGLDYWIWVRAHLPQLVQHLMEAGLTVPPAPAVVLDFVVAAKDGVHLSPYTAAQLEALDGSIPWQVHHLDEWDTDDPRVTSHGRRRVPPCTRVSPPAYRLRLEEHLVNAAGGNLHRRVFYASPGGGIVPEGADELALLRGNGLAHGFVDHVRSSQAFALNLFAGLQSEAQQSLWTMLTDEPVTPSGLEFEYADPHDALAEAQPNRPHRTQVDVLLRGDLLDGRRLVALVEVKLSETGFGSCSAFASAQNDRRDICRSAGPWGGDATRCFQLRNHDGPHRRRYDQFLNASDLEPHAPFCDFLALNQPMRNVALARALIARDEADAAVVALSAPRANRNIWRQWGRAQRVFDGVPGVSLRELPAERVLGALPEPRRTVLAERYGIEPQETP